MRYWNDMMTRLGPSVIILAALAPPALATAGNAENAFLKGLVYSLTDPVTHVAFLALVVFLLIVGRLGAFKFIFGSLDKRRDRIKSELDEAAQLREKAAEALALAERRAQDAEKEAEAIIERAREDAKTMLEEARRDLAAKIARREAQAEDRIARAEAEAATEVRRAAADAATEAARRVLQAKAGPEQFDAALEEIERALR